MPTRVESRWEAGRSAYESRIQDECRSALRGIGDGKDGRYAHGDGSSNLLWETLLLVGFPQAILKVLIIIKMKQWKSNSFGVPDSAAPSLPLAHKFLQFFAKKKPSDCRQR